MNREPVADGVDLTRLGWKPFFQQQLNLKDVTDNTVGRVMDRSRSHAEVLTPDGPVRLPLSAAMVDLTTGDWIVLRQDGSFDRRLSRSTLFARKAAGERAHVQRVAANIDTAFIVSSMNRDFNLNRIERYLALASEAGAAAVLVLTKADLCPQPDEFIRRAQALDPTLVVMALNALELESADELRPWCGPGNTVVFLGSSGVGKSTLINTLLGKAVQSTTGIREADSKGRHTTTSRSLHQLPGGGLLLDTPGMRELQLVACEDGIEDVFAEITAWARRCRFSNCQHEGEPGCAVLAEVKAGRIDRRRLDNYRKLLREQAFNESSLAERREKDRKLGRFYRSVLSDKQRMKRDR